MYLKLAWRNIWRNKRRSLITIGSILFAVFFALIMRLFQEGMYEMMIDSVVGVSTGHIQVHQKGYWDDKSIDNSMEFNEHVLKEIREVPHVGRACPRLESFAWVSNNNLGRGAIVEGLDPEEDVMHIRDKIVRGELWSAEGRSVMIGEGMAAYFGIETGDTLVLLGQGYHAQTAAAAYPVSGILKIGNPNLSDNLIVMPLKLAQEFCSAGTRISSVLVELDDIALCSQVKPYLERINFPGPVDVLDYKQMIPEVLEAIRADRVGGKIFIGILYVIISFGILGTVMMMTAERKYEYGVLISVGMHRFKLFMITLRESIMIACAGVVLGFLAAFPLIYRLHYHPLPFGKEEMEAFKSYGIEPVYYAVIDFRLCFEHMLIIFCIAMVVNLYPLVKIMKLRPVEAMRK